MTICWDKSSILNRTLKDFLWKLYKPEGVVIDRHIAIGNPSYLDYYGSDFNVDAILEMHSLGTAQEQLIMQQKYPFLRLPLNYRTDLFSENNAPWNLDRVDQRFDTLTGTYYYITTAHDVDAYIIDTGILVTHQEFQPPGRAIFLYNAVGDNIDTDCNGHGTHVAGILGVNTYGVAKGISIHFVTIL